MPKTTKSSVIKKTVALDPIMDKFIRKTWAVLIDEGHDATYSTALNFMLLASIFEFSKKRGVSPETKKMLKDFISDKQTLEKLKLHEHLTELRGIWGINH